MSPGEQIDTGSPLGQAVYRIIAAIAQLERSLIAERVRAGLRRARAEGGDWDRSSRGSWWSVVWLQRLDAEMPHPRFDRE